MPRRNLLLGLLAALIVGFGAGIVSNFAFPTPPDNTQFELKAACSGEKTPRVELAWALSPNADVNRIERREGLSGNLVVLFEEQSKPFDTFSYIDRTVRPDKTYYYLLTAYKDVATLPVEVKTSEERCRETLK